MRIKLFPFQRKAVAEMRAELDLASYEHGRTGRQQILSFQAPTGSGKTIIMTSLVEAILHGMAGYEPQPDAVFVWLSDSPELNEQSRRKMELKSDLIRLDQYETITGESFDKEELEDGRIYFLNTQKLAKDNKLVKPSDKRQFTIWETLANTARKKGNRLFFIIDEAHRGAQRGRDASVATSIMQRFIKGHKADEADLPPMPIVIGMSATPERFRALAGTVESATKRPCVVKAEEVRKSGLLKDRIVVTYPEDIGKSDEMALLGAAAADWKDKCERWANYCVEQHEGKFNPILVIQVEDREGDEATATNLADVIDRIQERTGFRLSEHEVVHTFGDEGTITAAGIPIHRVNPSDIDSDRGIRVVFFKQNLSTGWDCPKAETMMSFRAARDATYVAQLLGRMVRTPLQRHIDVDDTLNEVRLYLPHFSKDAVQGVIDELHSSEGGQIAAEVDYEEYAPGGGKPLTADAPLPLRKKAAASPAEEGAQAPRQADMLEESPPRETPAADAGSVNEERGVGAGPGTTAPSEVGSGSETGSGAEEHSAGGKTASGANEPHGQRKPPSGSEGRKQSSPASGSSVSRKDMIGFINDLGLETYEIRQARIIDDYLKSLSALVSLLAASGVDPDASETVKGEIADRIHEYVQGLEERGEYQALAEKVLSFRLDSRVFDAFGKELKDIRQNPLLVFSLTDLDRQWQRAESALAGFGVSNFYVNRHKDERGIDKCKTDCVLFVVGEGNLDALKEYAERRFHEIGNGARRGMVKAESADREQYNGIMADADKVSEQILHLPDAIPPPRNREGETYPYHLYADADGNARIKLNTWEDPVIKAEIQNPDLVCWLRNPSKGRWGLCIPYEQGGATKPMHPDFLVVRDAGDGYVLDLLEPHGPQFSDSLQKAKGLARYARKRLELGRVLFIREKRGQKGKFEALDMAKHEVAARVVAMNDDGSLDDVFANMGEDYPAKG